MLKLFISIVGILALMGDSASSSRAEAPRVSPALTLYLRDPVVHAGQASAVVLEIYNNTTQEWQVSSLPAYRREMILPAGARDAQANQGRQSPQKKAFFTLLVRCGVPATAGLAQFGDDAAQQETILVIAPGETRLLKIVLPPEAFAPGTCKLDVALQHGAAEVARSQTQDVRCETSREPPE